MLITKSFFLAALTFLLHLLLAKASSLSTSLKYGTAWKKEATSDLVYNAVKAGFRHIDTACQPKHYNEAGVGEGWTKAAQELGLSRENISLQTKFTSLNGQDPNRIPYDKDAPLAERVRQSLEKSLENLQTDYIDSLVMHGMENSWEDNFIVWRVFESFVDEGRVRQIGISNFYEADAVKYLFENARIKPAVVQNRFYKDSGYDTEIRSFCRDNGIEYQSFWTLGANRHFLRNAEVADFCREKQLTPETFMYAFVMAIGITPLDGTTNQDHMVEDMALLQRLRDGEVLFTTEELTKFAGILGIPNFEMGEEEEEL
mmetsp:Transcript_7187/g.10502  ORF Transcript_7187/g.10502 Transcript_7187/m.10502 type:complete len:315 (+) Transcript_7187:73-1017(+)